jgi:hypothetical protein
MQCDLGAEITGKTPSDHYQNLHRWSSCTAVTE